MSCLVEKALGVGLWALGNTDKHGFVGPTRLLGPKKVLNLDVGKGVESFKNQFKQWLRLRSATGFLSFIQSEENLRFSSRSKPNN